MKYIFILCIVIVIGCKKSGSIDNTNQNNAQISQRFKGKYSIVSATSNKQIDVNLDGVKSDDMLQEIPNLKYSYLELRLSDNLKNNLFEQFWQNQAFPYGSKPTAYDPNFYLQYANQATVGTFNFNSTLTRLEVNKGDTALQKEFPLPKLIEVISNDQIHIPTEKTLYTKSGMVPVTIDVIYKRFTTVL